MKKEIIIIIFSLLAIFWATSKANITGYDTVKGSRIPSQLDVIKDFEGEDDVMIRLVGYLPNGCFSKDASNIQVHGTDLLIENNVQLIEKRWCTMALIPYIDKIPVRDLSPGKYKIKVKDRFGKYRYLSDFTII